jgi:putative NADH-flavin reductase
MRTFIIGATGHTGQQLIDLALARGHSVTAFVRSPSKIERTDPRLSIVKGDPHDVDALAAAMVGHDAVFSALGVQPPKAFRPHTLVSECAATTVAAMTRANVRRFYLVSVAVLFPIPGLLYAFFRWMLKYIARDLAAAEEVVRATPLDWTIARPPRLFNGSDEHYLACVGALPDGGRAMSFRAVAKFMLDAAETSTYKREIVGLARA